MVDGDQLNTISQKLLVNVALRNMQKYDVLTLFYDAQKAPKHAITKESLYNSVRLAHEYSGIGQVSNSLTKLWNRENPDRESADLICRFNNAVIDAAKIGKINSYENYPSVNKKIQKAIGGKRSCMPFFFEFTKNGRRAENKDRAYAKSNNSTMNKICHCFDDIKKINYNMAGISPMNWQMFLKNDDGYNAAAADLFCEIALSHRKELIRISSAIDLKEIDNLSATQFVAQLMRDVLINRFGSLESVYNSVVKKLFIGENANKETGKQLFWAVFGNIACDNLVYNSTHYNVCGKCGAKVPQWAGKHVCNEKSVGTTTCIDCGKFIIRRGPRTNRCPECRESFRSQYIKNYNDSAYEARKKR